MSSPFKDKTVAIVGNGDLPIDKAEVERHDIVVMMNKGPSVWECRCDVYCYSGPFFNDIAEKLIFRVPVFYMTPKNRDKVPETHPQAIEFYPEAKWHILYNTLLGARPTTGLMVVDLVRSSGAKKITLFGFDFFETGTCAPVHCPNSEKRLLQEWGII